DVADEVELALSAEKDVGRGHSGPGRLGQAAPTVRADSHDGRHRISGCCRHAWHHSARNRAYAAGVGYVTLLGRAVRVPSPSRRVGGETGTMWEMPPLAQPRIHPRGAMAGSGAANTEEPGERVVCAIPGRSRHCDRRSARFSRREPELGWSSRAAVRGALLVERGRGHPFTG